VWPGSRDPLRCEAQSGDLARLPERPTLTIAVFGTEYHHFMINWVKSYIVHYVTVTVQDILRGDGIAVHPGTASNDDDHRHGNRGSCCSASKIIGGATRTSCSPNFLCNLQLKVILQTVRLLLNTKILENFLASGGFATDLIVHCVYRTYCIKLYSELDCLACFCLPVPSPKVIQFLLTQPKNPSRTYDDDDNNKLIIMIMLILY